MKQCTKCNKYNIEDSLKFCSNCGDNLSELTTCPSCNSRIWQLNAIIKCVACGKVMCNSCSIIAKPRDFGYLNNRYHNIPVCSGYCKLKYV